MSEAINDILSSAQIQASHTLIDNTSEHQYDDFVSILENIIQKEQEKKVEISISILEKLEETTDNKIYITPFFDKAKMLIQEVKIHDRNIRKILTTNALRNTNGAKFDTCNYEHRIKSLNSLVRKLLFMFLEKKYENDFERFKRDSNLASEIRTFLSSSLNIKDIYRCSYILNNTESIFKSQFIQILENLKNSGIFTLSVKNSFMDGNSYKDLKVFVKYPTDIRDRNKGIIFEIQFQTELTEKIKLKAHELYESIRENVSCEPEMIIKRKKEIEECIELYKRAFNLNINSLKDRIKQFAMSGHNVIIENKHNNRDTIDCSVAASVSAHASHANPSPAHSSSIHASPDHASSFHASPDYASSSIDGAVEDTEEIAFGYKKSKRKLNKKSKRRKSKKKSKRKTKRRNK